MSTQNKNYKLLFLCLLFPMLVLVGCGVPKQTQTKQKPGLILSGWNNSTASTYSNKTSSGYYSEGSGIDIEGKVGYRLEVLEPTAQCIPSGNNWTASFKIVSGQLPPGMAFEGWNIKGIPTKRGNYIVVLELFEIKCNDVSFGSMKQELRFHIGGVGIVND